MKNMKNKGELSADSKEPLKVHVSSILTVSRINTLCSSLTIIIY